MGKFGAYNAYGDMIQDEQRLDALRAKDDALTPQELKEKLTLFRTLSLTSPPRSNTNSTSSLSALGPSLSATPAAA